MYLTSTHPRLTYWPAATLLLLLMVAPAMAYSLAPSVPGPSTQMPAPLAVTDLGTLGGTTSAGNGVNNKGDVVGLSHLLGDKITHAFLYANGKIIDLGTLGGDNSEATALNDAGQVTGNADIKPRKHRPVEAFVPRSYRHVFFWQQGQMTDLDTQKSGNSFGAAINSSGQVSGAMFAGDFGIAHACSWTGGILTLLDKSDALFGSSGDAINSNGQVFGNVRKTGLQRTNESFFVDQAVLWQGSKPLELSVRDTTFSLAKASNDRGQVAGGATFGTDKLLHACLWQNGKMIDKGAFAEQNTIIYALNRAGRMVGGTNPTGLYENENDIWNKHEPQHAICFSDNVIIDLNDMIDPSSGWVLAEACGISDTGYVTGTGFHNGQSHAYLLKLPADLHGY